MNDETVQRQEFRNILFELASSDFNIGDSSVRTSMYVRLENLYHPNSGTEGFRHFYSDIFAVLTTIQQGDMPGDMESLGTNLQMLRMEYHPKNIDVDGNLIDIQDKLRKLDDHVSLDIARINYSDGADRKVGQSENITLIRGEVTKVQKNIDVTKDVISKLEVKLNETQKEYITILGIFSSVVLTFTAGIAFSSSVLQNAHNMSIYKIAFVSLLTGTVLLNVLYGLFYYIHRLVRSSVEDKMYPLIIANSVFIALMITTIILWNRGIVEQRNARFSEESSITEPTVEVTIDIAGAENSTANLGTNPQ